MSDEINPDAAHLNFSRMWTGDKIADELIANEKLEGAGTFHARDVSCGVCSYR